MKYAAARLSTWEGITPGATHYWAKMSIDGSSFDFTYIANEEDTKNLNDWISRGAGEDGFRPYKVGEEQQRFSSRSRVVEEIQRWAIENSIDVVFESDGSVELNPSEILYADPSIDVSSLVLLYERAEDHWNSQKGYFQRFRRWNMG